jgi:cysteine desulfurase
MTIYLDHAATTSIRQEAVEAVMAVLVTGNGNASGTHAVARSAKNVLEDARERAAVVIGASRPDEVVFTSGGTESDNLAVVGAGLAGANRTIVVSSIEHKAVLEPARGLVRFGCRVVEVPCDGDGVVDPDAVEQAVGEDTGVVSVMAANNEVGAVQPIGTIARVVREKAPGAVIHTDAVQAFVGASIDVDDLDVDLMTLAAHKFGGPKGVGLLYVRSGVALEPLITGGGQEAGRRPGTSNVAGVAGMVAAMEAAEADRGRFAAVVGGERDAFESAITQRYPDAVVTARGVTRLPHFSHLRLPGVRAESLLIRLDAHGVCAAAGSACQSGAVESSHVLTAMGMSDIEARSCVRFTMGWDTAPGDGERAAAAVGAVLDAMSERT